MAKSINFGEDSRRKLIKGVDTLADAVKVCEVLKDPENF